jgi:phenylpyruvate tautomerase PptA (4-oxalocrotonate tautomerase family)
MARYLIQVPRDVLAESQKAGVAKAIVAAHHEITGDEPGSVQVAVTEIDAGCFFRRGPPDRMRPRLCAWLRRRRDYRTKGSPHREDLGRRHQGRRLRARFHVDDDLRTLRRSMQGNLSASELNDRIAVLQDNIRQLVEQAAALSGNADDDRTSDRIAQQSAELEALLEQREALQKH